MKCSSTADNEAVLTLSSPWSHLPFTIIHNNSVELVRAHDASFLAQQKQVKGNKILFQGSVFSPFLKN